MENEKLIIVLNELMQNQREIITIQAETAKVVKEIKIQLEQFENTVENYKSELESTSVKPIQQTLENCISEIKFLSNMIRQKTHTNNLRVFLESDAKK